MTSDYINDGYTRDGYIATVDRLYGELRFKYRPFLAEEDATLADATRRLPANTVVLNYAKTMAQRIKEWNLLDSQGNAVPISAETVARLSPPLFHKLKGIVTGWEPSDEDPNAPNDAKLQSADTALDALLAGTTVGVIQEAADAKN